MALVFKSVHLSMNFFVKKREENLSIAVFGFS